MRERSIIVGYLVIAVLFAALSGVPCLGQVLQSPPTASTANPNDSHAQVSWEAPSVPPLELSSRALQFENTSVNSGIGPLPIPAGFMESASSPPNASPSRFASSQNELVPSNSTAHIELPAASVPAPPDLPLNEEMQAYYAVFTTYARPVSFASLPQPAVKVFTRPAPVLSADNSTGHAIGQRHSPSMHKLLFPVRMVKVASLATAKVMHRLFVDRHPADQQSLSSSSIEIHRALPDSTRDPYGGFWHSGLDPPHLSPPPVIPPFSPPSFRSSR